MAGGTVFLHIFVREISVSERKQFINSSLKSEMCIDTGCVSSLHVIVGPTLHETH